MVNVITEEKHKFRISNTLKESEYKRLTNLLDKYLAITGDTRWCGAKVAPLDIVLREGVFPVRRKPYRYSPSIRKEISEQVSKLKDLGILRDCVSPCDWASPVVMPLKEDGTLRLCGDWSIANKCFVRSVYPMPMIGDILSAVKGSQFFSKIDLEKGFWKKPIKEECKQFTTKVTGDGSYQFNFMPVGLSNGPQEFQRDMDLLFADCKDFCRAFQDDIFINILNKKFR